jgi:putative transposase
VALSTSDRAVAEALARAIDCRGQPLSITVDHGTESTSHAMGEWAYRRGVKLDSVCPGKPVAGGFIESLNGRFREESLNALQFLSIDYAGCKINAWWHDRNHHRPQSSLGH